MKYIIYQFNYGEYHKVEYNAERGRVNTVLDDMEKRYGVRDVDLITDIDIEK